MIDFSGYTREKIQNEMLSQVPKSIDTRQGSIIQTAVGPVAWYLEGLYMRLAQVQENTYPETAVGEALDLLAQTRGIFRKSATAAVRKGFFDAPVSEGSRFKTINGANSVIFISGEMLSETDEEYCYEMLCSQTGVIGNSYTGRILPITAIPGLTEASIGEIISSGTEEETDEALRSRYMASFDMAAFGGNISSYRNEILAIEGVGAVQVYPVWNGGGTVLCSILGDDLKPALPATVREVQNLICPPEDGQELPSDNGYGVAPIGALVTITTASEATLDITCDIEFTEAARGQDGSFQSQVEEKIEDYLSEVRASWGSPLKSHKVQYPVSVYLSRMIYAIMAIPEIVNVTNVKINGAAEDLHLTETAELQQIPVLGTVIINGGQ